MNIIVTGASRGIGYELVKAYAEDIRVKNVFAISRNRQGLDRLILECKELGRGANIYAVVGDISSPDFNLIYKEEIESRIEGLDIMVNNAGYLVKKPFAELSEEDVLHTYKVNVFAVFRLVKLALPQLERAKKAHIVNIGSIGGVQGSVKFAGLSAYSSSKSALTGLSECLAEEFKGTQIAVNCLALGAVDTEMLAQAFPGYKAPVTAVEMASYIKEFSIGGHLVYNGKVLQVSLSTP